MSFPARVVLSRRLRFLPRRAYLIAHHALFQGELTTLRRPRTYSQMLAAKNLRPQPPIVHLTSDKYAVRDYVAEKVGAQYLVPMIALLERIEDLDHADLAGRALPCVIKGTHGCDMTLLLPDPQVADMAAIRATVARWLGTDFYSAGFRESPYKGIPPRAIVEEFIGKDGKAPVDYKFFMFNGEPAMIVVDQDRFTDHTSTLLTPDWRVYDVTGRFAFAAAAPPRPANLDEMIDVARKLGADFSFVRVDLYNVDGRIFFGELTHNPGGGLVRLRPRAFDRALGDLWRNGTPIPQRFVRR